MFSTHRVYLWFIQQLCWADHSYSFWVRLHYLAWPTVWTRLTHTNPQSWWLLTFCWQIWLPSTQFPSQGQGQTAVFFSKMLHAAEITTSRPIASRSQKSFNRWWKETDNFIKSCYHSKYFFRLQKTLNPKINLALIRDFKK